MAYKSNKNLTPMAKTANKSSLNSGSGSGSASVTSARQFLRLRRSICLSLLFALCLAAAQTADGSPTGLMSSSSMRVQQCREGCFDKFATKEMLCQQNMECLTCWDDCTKTPPVKVSKSIRETWSLYTVSMLLQDSLVLVDVAWAPLITPNQCLVTWEVSGGGLMGNLLTESSNVQLSLWPDTKYRVQVTCQNKFTGAMSRSLPLIIDTSEASTSHASDDNGPLAVVPQRVDAAGGVTTLLPTKLSAGTRPESVEAGDDSAASIEQENLPVAPYDDDIDNADDADNSQSDETLNQHTNFIFNWHTLNNDISSIEPLHKPSFNMLSIATLSEMRKPLMFGVVAGTLLLAIVLLMYVCISRQQQFTADKAGLIAEAGECAGVSLPPAVVVAAAAAAAAANQGDATSSKSNNSSSTSNRNTLKV